MLLYHLPELEEALRRLQVLDPIVLGDLNFDPDSVRSPRSHLMADLLTEFDLIDLVQHLIPRLQFQDLKTWTQVLQGNVLHSQCY